MKRIDRAARMRERFEKQPPNNMSLPTRKTAWDVIQNLPTKEERIKGTMALLEKLTTAWKGNPIKSLRNEYEANLKRMAIITGLPIKIASRNTNSNSIWHESFVQWLKSAPQGRQPLQTYITAVVTTLSP